MRAHFLNRAYPPGVESTCQLVAELTGDLTAYHQVSAPCGRPDSDDIRARVFPYRRESQGKVEVWRAWSSCWRRRFAAARISNRSKFFAIAKLVAQVDALVKGQLVAKNPRVVELSLTRGPV